MGYVTKWRFFDINKFGSRKILSISLSIFIRDLHAENFVNFGAWSGKRYFLAIEFKPSAAIKKSA